MSREMKDDPRIHDEWSFDFPKSIGTVDGSRVANHLLRELMTVLGKPVVARGDTPIAVWFESLGDVEALRARVAELETALAEAQRNRVYLNATSTAPGYPTGTWPTGTEPPPPSIAAFGAPEHVEAVKAELARGRAAEARVAELEAALLNLHDGLMRLYDENPDRRLGDALAALFPERMASRDALAAAEVGLPEETPR